ncbi:hypothetical protein [Paenibacillus graminis]|uniref:hypothetical protein n=1 Tax=Paenibacillus graminis TaxID=189425 RepID=UPI002DBBEB15|nr:hypothetical protein [Paenibacillus graminis]MEC0169853.1 hypothetical protein [Paenibacillus graminis]
MRVRPIVIGLATLLVGSFILMGTINVQAADVNPNHAKTDTVEAIVPEYVSDRLNHPDVIYTEDGMYEKKQLSVSEFSQDEITYDATNTTAETKAIVDYDATYLKVKDNN